MRNEKRRPAKNAAAPLPQISTTEVSGSRGATQTPVQRMLALLDDAVLAALEYQPGPTRDEAFELAALSLATRIAKYKRLVPAS